MKLGIIGGGGASVALLAALTREQVPELDITIFEPEQAVGPGRAYLDDSDSALLNVTAERMSLFPDTTGEFLEWVRAVGALDGAADSIESGDYLPRRLFGMYLEQAVTEIAGRMANEGRRLQIVESAVVQLSQELGHVHVMTESGQQFSDLDRIVLCVGAGRPMDIHNLRGFPGYIDDPYPLRDRISGIPPYQDVLVLGTGLASVDVVLFLLQNSHRGCITMASRNGLLPSVRTSVVAPPLRYLSKTALQRALLMNPQMTLDRLFRRFEAELSAVDLTLDQVCAEARPGENFARRLQRQLQQVGEDGTKWQPVMIRAMHEAVELIWHAMPNAERRRFLEEWHQRFVSLLSPMPQSTAAQLMKAADAGQLQVHRYYGAVKASSDSASSFQVITKNRLVSAAIVINTIRSTSAAIPDRATALVAALIEDGTAQLHPFGGVEINPHSNRLLDAQGRDSQRLFALGHLTGGAHYYTSSMLKISQQAKVIADQLIAEAQ